MANQCNFGAQIGSVVNSSQNQVDLSHLQGDGSDPPDFDSFSFTSRRTKRPSGMTKLPTAAGPLIPKQEHISPVTASLHWLPARLWSDFKSLLFDFKCQRAVTPAYLTALHHSYTILWGSQVGSSVFVVWLHPRGSWEGTSRSKVVESAPAIHQTGWLTSCC